MESPKKKARIGVGGFVGIGAQALILHPDEAQRVLSTPAKPFYVTLSI